ncbi:MAG: hypothetical protein DA328_00415 [Nitrososphaeraceae archaeon]|nr:hypothetical protein [Nitrososphaeraceae archaeon]
MEMRSDSKWIKAESNYQIKIVGNSRYGSQELDFMNNTVAISVKINVIKELLNRQILKLQEKFNQLISQDNTVLEKLIVSNNENNIQYSTLLLSELYNIRDTCKAILVSKIILEDMTKKIDNFDDCKKVTENLSILFSSVCSINSLLIRVSEFSGSIKLISNVLKDLLIDMGHLGGNVIDFMESNSQVKKLMDCANALAETKIKNQVREINNINIP